ncbi:hypothetical protein D1F64_05210 [Breoghania sp. L-A4]|nr:hypothetical protein D1F64_05210 [Breoghania sp. L-A4]
MLIISAGAPASAAAVKTESILVEPETPDPATGAQELEVSPPQEAPDAEVEAPVVYYGDIDLPKPVQRMRAQMLDAAASGDIERLRPVLEANEVMPTLSFGSIDDPIAFLKQSSGDDEGRELLAILIEVLEAGWVHVDAGTPQEMYIWPYFARYPLDKLDARQMVEMYKLLTAADYEDMKSFGAYIFYRVGIGPDGTLHYFVAGD